MHPERVVRTMADLRKALLIPLDPTDDLADEEFEDLLRHPVVKARLDKAVTQADAGLGIPDDELDAFFRGEKE